MEKRKNCWIIPTEQPSWLLFNQLHKSFCIKKEIDGMYINDGKVTNADFWGLEKASNNGFIPHYIYITSSEDIKDGDWVFDNYAKINLVQKVRRCDLDSSHYKNGSWKKIILTTDPKLIADGVQKIDNEFLEWFVKNSSCDFVKVESYKIDKEWDEKHTQFNPIYPMKNKYKIIISQEEPKQDSTEDWKELEDAELCEPLKSWDELKQETLEYREKRAEELLKAYKSIFVDCSENYKAKRGFIEGANYQAERMYSEEDMIRFMQYIISNPDLVSTSSVSETTAKYYIEQFKKK